MSNVSSKEYTVAVAISIDDGKAIWDVQPETLHVEPGLQQITWNLSGPAEFATNGIEFPREKNPIAWPGRPVQKDPKQFTSDDDNTTKAPPAIVHPYTINVTGSDGKTYSLDPDVSNDPPGG
jgi:hypothetical protein